MKLRSLFTGIATTESRVFDDFAIIGVYEKGADSVLVKNLSIPYNENTNDTLPIILNDPCLTIPPDVCVHKATYRISRHRHLIPMAM